MPREIAYRVSAIFEIGVYDFDKAYVVMPMENAQLLLLTGDQVGMIEIKTTDPDKVGEILQPLAEKVAAQAVISDWRSMNSSLFEALSVERVAMFVILSLIVLVAAFNIISSPVSYTHLSAQGTGRKRPRCGGDSRCGANRRGRNPAAGSRRRWVRDLSLIHI